MLTVPAINELDQAAFTALLGPTFEHSPWVAENTWSQRPFRDAGHLHLELCASMRRGTAEQQWTLIQVHPDLAGRLARDRTLTVESIGEQASAGLDQLGADEAATFAQLNAAYRARFGFPFIICARLNARDAILRALQARLNHSPAEEHAAALAEIEKIAWLRLEDVLNRR